MAKPARWYTFGARTYVETCVSVTPRELGVTARGYDCGASSRWCAIDGREIFRAHHSFNTMFKEEAWVTFRHGDATGAESVYRVRLDAVAQRLGGWRWWFRCPRVECGRRVGKLHLPGDADRFACRHCLGITYETCYTQRRSRMALAPIAARLGTSPRELRKLLKRHAKDQERLLRRLERVRLKASA